VAVMLASVCGDATPTQPSPIKGGGL
jgi:hypothetical protein